MRAQGASVGGRRALVLLGLGLGFAAVAASGFLVAAGASAGVAPAAAAGGVPPRWVLCAIGVLGTVVNLFIPNPVAGVYALAWAAVARAHCT